ncbi:MAG: hypothetical protein HZB41_05050 [Ignavibacteriae bacterium]|nr:hypothetical protein [Ignavibacteriota bacterium]
MKIKFSYPERRRMVSNKTKFFINTYINTWQVPNLPFFYFQVKFWRYVAKKVQICASGADLTSFSFFCLINLKVNFTTEGHRVFHRVTLSFLGDMKPKSDFFVHIKRF